MEITSSAPAKVILFGEHSVVYDKLGIAGAVNPRTNITIKENNKLKICLSDYKENITTTFDEISCTLNKIEKLQKERKYQDLKVLSGNRILMIKTVIGKALNKKECRPFELKIKSNIHIGGFGSGSAIFASTAAAVQLFSRQKLDKQKIAEAANLGDTICHGGTPSGIDASAVTYGGYIEFQKSRGLNPIQIKNKLPVVIGITGIPAKTSETVPHVRELKEKNPEKMNKHLNEMHNIAIEGIKNIKKGNMEKVGSLMNENQNHLEQIEVSHSKLEKLISASLNAGALGAKLSGGGGGGIMIALCRPEDQERVAQAIEKAGGTSLITEMGVEGVRKEL